MLWKTAAKFNAIMELSYSVKKKCCSSPDKQAQCPVPLCPGRPALAPGCPPCYRSWGWGWRCCPDQDCFCLWGRRRKIWETPASWQQDFGRGRSSWPRIHPLFASWQVWTRWMSFGMLRVTVAALRCGRGSGNKLIDRLDAAHLLLSVKVWNCITLYLKDYFDVCVYIS